MHNNQQLLATQFVTLFTVLDPLSHVALFLALTGHFSPRQKHAAAITGVATAFLVLAAFGLGGQALLKTMGVSLRSFQIAGGVIMLVFAMTMVLGSGEIAHESGAGKSGSPFDTAIYPLAVPVIAGPAALLCMVLMMDGVNNTANASRMQVLGVLVAVLALLLLALLLGDRISRAIGNGGANLLRRILGMVLAAVAVNTTLAAVGSWLELPPI